MLRLMKFELGPAYGRDRRVLSAIVKGERAGSLNLGLADADDPDDPKVRLDYIRVHEAFHATGMSTDLICDLSWLNRLVRDFLVGQRVEEFLLVGGHGGWEGLLRAVDRDGRCAQRT
jgi:hypothetical protein